ncbi:MAG TPA: two-component regulator propeller domain-containing protein, partial [Cryomorphaceae bacterium]|nr:two-component regulator propeller domain-containing protein [Cryomorphaceae bacterium]
MTIQKSISMMRNRSISFIILCTTLALVLFSCDNKPESIPFPQDKTELLPPSSEPLRFTAPKKFEWQVNDSTTFQKPVPIKVDLASVPSKPFYPDGFLPLDQPMDEMPFTMRQDTVINFEELPWEPIEMKTSILEPPTRVKARLPKLNKNASVGIFEFGEDHGLPGSIVTAMMEDSQGMIWIATDYGICRFDGEYIETYDILDERFTGAQTLAVSMLEDRKGRIWIYTKDMGFYVLDLHAGIVRNAILIKDRFRRFDFGNSMIMDSKDRIWFGTQSEGVFVVDPNEFNFKNVAKLRPGDNGDVRQLAEDKFGKIWIGSDSGLSMIDPETGQVQSHVKQSNFSFSSINGFFCDSENNIWVGTENEGIARIHSGRESSKVLGSDQGVQAPVYQFTEGQDGKIWISTNGDGIYIFDPVLQKLKQLNRKKGLSDDRVYLSFLDSSGQIWIATTKGLNLMDTEGLMPNFLTEEDGLSWPNVWSFMEDRNGDLWLGAWESMDIYDSENHAIKRVDLALQLEKNISIPFQSMQMPSGNYLIKVPSLGLAIYNPDQSTITKITPENGLTNLYQSSCFVDRSGKIWTGGFRNGGIEVYDPQTNSFKRITNEFDLIGNLFWGIHEDAIGQIWVGTDVGVNIINLEENTISYLVEGENTTTRNFGTFLTDQQNRMWMGTRTGILVADQKNELLTSISSENGLISPEVYTLYEHDGVMYAGTENGLTSFATPPSFSTDLSVLDIKSYAKEQGLIFNNFNADAAIAYDDKLWWGIETEVLTVTEIPKRDTVKGTTYISGIAISDKNRNFYDYELAHDTYTDLDTLFSAQKDTFFLAEQRPQETGWLNENDIKWNGLEGNYNLPTNLEIPYEQNYVSFQFTGAQLKNRNKTRYSYYLQGYDEVWSDLSPDPFSKNYRNLPAGNYTFHVQSKIFEGGWSEPATFS